MIDKVPDGDAFREIGNATEMIAVVVGNNQVIDLPEAGVVDGSDDALGVPALACEIAARVSRIDEQRLAGR